MGRKISAAVLLFMLASFGCKGGDLRGTSKPSTDGNTYLVVADDNGGQCQLMLDGKLWTHPKGEAGRVESGHHTLSSCGADISFDIHSGTVYSFDYWGP